MASSFEALLNRSCCPDHPQPDDEDLPSYRNVKVFVYVWDVPLSGGETAVVPGTHRVAGSPGETLSPGKFASAANGDAAAQSTMPNLVRAAVGAGCALLFDSSIWHTSMPNTSGRDRCNAPSPGPISLGGDKRRRGGNPGVAQARTKWHDP